MAESLGPRHPEVRRLRALLRSGRARDDERLFVVEGPRVVAEALEREVSLRACYASPAAIAEQRDLLAALRRRGVPVRALAPGVVERVADTRHTQGVLATAALVRRGVEALERADLVLVATRVADPGNAGTMLRSAEAFGVDAVAFGAGSVDAYNPKVVRASAGAIFGVRVAERCPAVEVLEALADRGITRWGAVAHGGEPLWSADLARPSALVVGHETAGLEAGAVLDATVTIPMVRGESLNVAMAATVLCYEARRRRADGEGPR